MEWAELPSYDHKIMAISRVPGMAKVFWIRGSCTIQGRSEHGPKTPNFVEVPATCYDPFTVYEKGFSAFRCGAWWVACQQELDPANKTPDMGNS